MMLDGMFKNTAKKKKDSNLSKEEVNKKLKLVHEWEKQIEEEKSSPKKKISSKKKKVEQEDEEGEIK